MSLADVLSGKHVDEGLDDVFNSSAGPSSVTLSKAIRVTSTSRKRRAEDGPQNKDSKKSRGSIGEPNATKVAYREKDGKERDKKQESNKKVEAVEQNEAASDDEETDTTIPEHETTRQRDKRRKNAKKAKYVPEGETREQRDARTIFIGNLPVTIIKNKSLKKQLNRHVLSLVPTAKIESIRFRSVAFRSPTSALEGESKVESSRQSRELKRTAEWRSRQLEPNRPTKHDNGIEEAEKDGKNYMAPAEKRRLAAIKGEIHEHSSATTNAYLVFAYQHPTSAEPVPAHAPRKEVMDPIEAAREAALKLNGTLFADHVLRVDLTAKPVGTTQDLGPSAVTDPRLSIFVGNLDFASSEDDVRAFFEKIICEERGKPNADADVNGDDSEDGEASAPRRPSWVTRVRLIRDRETQLGKGFAYVQFSDRDCVDEVLALETEKLKFAKRTLRVQKCKTSPSTPLKPSKRQVSEVAAHTAPSKALKQSDPISLPKGDPTLGTRLAGLPKEARRKVKASDPTRVARRLAKKKTRIALEKTEKTGKHLRERRDKKTKGALNSGKKRKRERSERSLQRKNVKK